MSNQVYIPPINFNENENFNSSIVSINAIEPLEYNKLNSNLSIKAATENNYGVITTGTQTFKGLKTFSDNLTIYTGSILTDPTNDTDITNKKYVESSFTNNIASADLVKYDTSTNYLINNKTDSNITNLNINSLNVSDNYINKEPNTVLVRARGAAGTFDKYITIYKSILNGKISIIFDKNLIFNDYSNVTDISLKEMIFNISDMSNISQIYEYLPYEFELTGEVSTYGGTHNIATKTLKFRKSPSDLYKYDLIYDKSFPFNIFKLKESIKNIDTVINTTEIQKINSLTIDKGYLINAPTEDNNLVNKGYVDNVKSELNENITTAISNISSVSLTNGTISTTPSAANDIANKKYVDFSIADFETITNNKINSEIGEALSNLSTVNLTTGTISTTPTNDTDIANKKYVGDAITEATNSMEYVKYNNESKILYQTSSTASQPINNLNLNNLTSNNSTINDLTATSTTTENLTTTNTTTINNNLNLSSGIVEFKNFVMVPIVNSNSSLLKVCTLVFLKIKISNVLFINIKFNFEPFTTDGNTLYIKNLELTDIGSTYSEYNIYFCNTGTGESNNLKAGRCTMYLKKNNEGKYDIEIANTISGDVIYKFDDFKIVYYLNES